MFNFTESLYFFSFQTVVDAFKIKTNNSDVLLHDQYNTPIRTKNMLHDILNQFGNDSNFFLKVGFKSRIVDDSLITSEVGNF